MRPPGILALQGGFDAHSRSLQRLGVEPILVRTVNDLQKAGSLIFPGGESTAIFRLLRRRNLLDPLRERIREGMAAYGSCAGMILLSDSIDGIYQETLGAMGIRVLRNAYGSQLDSFETELQWKQSGYSSENQLAPSLEGIFIRAPRIVGWDDTVEVLMEYDGSPVLVREGKLMASSFHPELTDSSDIHRFFLEELAGYSI